METRNAIFITNVPTYSAKAPRNEYREAKSTMPILPTRIHWHTGTSHAPKNHYRQEYISHMHLPTTTSKPSLPTNMAKNHSTEYKTHWRANANPNKILIANRIHQPKTPKRQTRPPEQTPNETKTPQPKPRPGRQRTRNPTTPPTKRLRQREKQSPQPN